MPSLAEYFSSTRYQPIWQIGDRVQGHWNQIPFRGTVGNDTEISETEGPRVSVHVDLPIYFNDRVHTFVIVRPSELKKFQQTSTVNITKTPCVGCFLWYKNLYREQTGLKYLHGHKYQRN